MKSLIITLSLISFLRAFDVKQLDVMVLPDYLYKGVAVEFNGEISPDSRTVPLGLLVPADIDSVVIIHDVGSQSPRMENPAVQTRNNEKWIVANLDPGKFRIIYFYTPYTPTGERDFEFILKTDKNLDAAHLGVQKPIAAENFFIDLEGAEKSTDQHGSEVYNAHIHGFRAGAEKRMRIRYLNPEGKTTLEALRAMLNQPGAPAVTSAAEPSGKTAPVRHKLPTWEPLAALAIVAFVVYRMFKNQPVKRKNKKSNRKLNRGQFCSNCGKKIVNKARFCSSCGEKLG